jgi:aspartokinase-like uncharacterized kinase
MTRPAPTIVKVGGSLFDWQGLPSQLTAYLARRRALDPIERVVLIGGGGPAAEWVRTLDRTHRLGDEEAHRLALHALDLTAVVLEKLLPGSIVCHRLETLPTAWDCLSIPILAVRQVLLEIDRDSRDPLPANWDVTSDTIAARIATFLEASSLVLLKSAPLPQAATLEDAARMGLVDPVFPSVARSIPQVEYVNLRTDPVDCRVLPT